MHWENRQRQFVFTITLIVYITYYIFNLIELRKIDIIHTRLIFFFNVLVIPAAPTKIAVVDQTESSVKLSWSLGTMSFYSYGLIYKIQYKSQWDSDPEHWNVSVQSYADKS